MVSLHFDVLDDAGNVLESSRTEGAPVEFESGVGDIVGNPLYQVSREKGRPD